MNDATQQVLDYARKTFAADEKAEFAVMRITPEQVIQMALEDQIFDAVPLMLDGGFPAAAVGPQWAIVERASLDDREHDHPTAMLMPYEREGEQPPCQGQCRTIWDMMNSAHIQGYSLAEFLAGNRSAQRLAGLRGDD